MDSMARWPSREPGFQWLPPSDNWVDAVLVAVIEAYDMLAFMTVTPLRESPMCMGGTEEDSCGMI